MSNFKIVMCADSQILSFAEPAARINAAYARKHGYEFAFESEFVPNIRPHYERIRLLKRHLFSADYLLYLDADAVVIDFRKSLDQFVHGNADLILSGHEFGFNRSGHRVRYQLYGIPCGLNSGVILLRSCEWAERFLDWWWQRSLIGNQNHVCYADQTELQEMLMANEVDMQLHARLIVPACRFNRGDEDGRDICEFILHLWGTSHTERANTFHRILHGDPLQTSIELPNYHVELTSSSCVE